MTPNVSSWCASYEGGSEGTTKISSPPERGLSWAEASPAASGPSAPRVNASRARVHVLQILIGVSLWSWGLSSLGEPHRVELVVEEVAGRDGPPLHPRAVGKMIFS